MKHIYRLVAAGMFTVCLTSSLTAADQPVEFADKLRSLDASVIVVGKVRQPPLASMLARDMDAGLRQANRADSLAWKKVQTRADWEAFRDARLTALRQSLGTLPPAPKTVKVRVTRTLEGDGYRIDNLVYESRPGLIVTANLYRPSKPAASMPGIVICHSHQQPKHVGFRQDMAMTWARAGCTVLVPDHLGHGERRQHPFGSASDSAPHDYHFRYDLGIQLHLVGESLMGWLARDLMRGVDVLLAQPGVDPQRIVMISEPAGGGDVAAVTAALDPRITCVMVNNFGGPEPENAYPLAKDAEDSFDFAGSGSWESTRNLHRSARDGFLPWTIIASIAPRRLIYNHEFYWDQTHDPVWQRLQKVYGFYNAKDAVIGMAGRGFVVGSAPENTHWLAECRERMYPLLDRWFKIPNPKQEYSKRRPVEELLCLTPASAKEFAPQPLHVLASQIASQRVDVRRKVLSSLPPNDRKDHMRKGWARLLGDVDPPENYPKVTDQPIDKGLLGNTVVQRIHLTTEPGIVVPMLLLIPLDKRQGNRPVPVVVALCQEGKQEFLRQRADAIASLLEAGVAVCLPDVRGTGETSPRDSRDRRSATTTVASSALMLGQPVLGGRLRDVRCVLRYLRNHPSLKNAPIALWGESFAASNPAGQDLQVPYTAENRPNSSEPLGGLLALLGGLYEDDVRAVYVQRGLSDFRSVVAGQFRYVPYDVVVPGVLTLGDLCDLVGILAPRPVRLDSLVDGLNREVPKKTLVEQYQSAFAAYRNAKTPAGLEMHATPGSAKDVARWLASALGK